jgi:hypothetical protein
MKTLRFIYAAVLTTVHLLTHAQSYSGPPIKKPEGIPFGIVGVDDLWVELKLNSTAREAVGEAVVIAEIPSSATEHSPACASGRIVIATISMNQRTLSNCVRMCAQIPVGYELDGSRQIAGNTSHAYSALFNTQYFPDTKRACIFAKNWSSDQAVSVSMTVPLCVAGAGCKPPTSPVQPPEKEKIPEKLLREPGSKATGKGPPI